MTYQIRFITPSGYSTIVASKIAENSCADSLCQARKAFFGRKGTISYTNLRADCNGASLVIEKEIK